MVCDCRPVLFIGRIVTFAVLEGYPKNQRLIETMEEEPVQEEYDTTEHPGSDADPSATPAEAYQVMKLSGMFENWFLDYASYVILERAVPMLDDGLKPVQRRLLHAMKELDDGRFNKVANIIGHTMKYHPHGDASIGDALVQLGQKEILIDMQGNWGNILTGDSAAAPRYIEARLSKFALEVVFNPKTTLWKASYDGRNKEPVALPVKFPLLLAQGVEGIAVGLASKILSHNFVELINGSIAILKEEPFVLYPDFLNGGLMDVSKYNDGLRGGKIRLRARINILDKKTLVISEIPFSTTTGSLIDTIIAANDKGKIKIRKIEDNTAAHPEILIHLPPGTSPDQTIDALYAFTNCEISISPNSCVIADNKPLFTGVSDLLRRSTIRTKGLLEAELQIQLKELEEQWHFSSLEKIFIEKRIYRDIEECETWEAVIQAIEMGLKPYLPLFRRDVTRDDIVRLTEIKIKRISKFDAFKADEVIKAIEDDMAKVKEHLEHLTDYAISWFERLLKKYGEGRQRRTEIRNFETIEATSVAVANARLYVDREEGFAGLGLKKAEYVCDCSDIDDIIVFRRDGTLMVSKVSEKTFIGKDIIHIDVFKRNDERTTYNLVYRDGQSGNNYVKRFAVIGVTRDKEYNLTKGTAGSKVLYFTANPNGEAEVVKVLLRPKPRLRKLHFEFDFKELAIKGRASQGNVISRFPIKSIVKKEEGVSTLGAVNVWFDDSVRRLNYDQRGTYLGAFRKDEKILVIYRNGEYRLYGYDLSTHFDDDLLDIRKFDNNDICNVVYKEAESLFPYLKRFTFEAIEKRISFTGGSGSVLVSYCFGDSVTVQIGFVHPRGEEHNYTMDIDCSEFVGVKGFSAKGKRISKHDMSATEWRLPDEIGNADDAEHADNADNAEQGDSDHDSPTEPETPATGKSEEPETDQDGVTRVSMDKDQGIQMELEL
jgi:topoisomerase IV subunit A